MPQDKESNDRLNREHDQLEWERRQREKSDRFHKALFERNVSKLNWELDIIPPETSEAYSGPAKLPPSLRDDILKDQKDILCTLRCGVGLEALLKDDWISRVANLTDAGWKRQIAALRQDVAEEKASWQRANATNVWRRESFREFLDHLDESLALLESKLTRFYEGP